MTTATTSLTDFLLARIAEDEEVAREAIPGTYSPNADEDGSWRMIEVDHEGIWPEPASKPVPSWGYESGELWAEHVTRHDPARVLAECEAKRPLIHRWQNATPDGDDWAQEAWAAMCAWAVAYADHPDYNPDWRP